MDKLLQTGLSAGMSATAGIHSATPTPVSHDLAGKNTMPADFVPGPKDRVSFRTANGEPVKASYICVGAWPWGDKATFHWDESELPAVRRAWKTLYDAGINFIDTAESYGHGRSEEIVGELIAGLPRESLCIQTKWTAVPVSPNNILHPVDAPLKSLKGSLKRMKLDYVDIYMVHGPTYRQSIETVAKGVAQCVEAGLARAIAIANHSPEDVKTFNDHLSKYGVPLAANQTEFNILRRWPELHGNIAMCQKEGVVFQSYSSLAQGRLSGKYNADNPPPSSYKFSSYDMKVIEPTLAVLRRIGAAHDVSPASVALNYNISKGAVPLVGIRNETHAKDAIAALGWRLSQEEVVEIDKVSMEGKSTVLWQQG
jgi:aryl-alcohol dehydrogenase-like predicted oxidoreductase